MRRSPCKCIPTPALRIPSTQTLWLHLLSEKDKQDLPHGSVFIFAHSSQSIVVLQTEQQLPYFPTA